MTAEIALLNKVAVALAADSAATISSGDRDEKVFNSEDKLFQLSDVQPIGVMVYNAPFFLETPIQILIKSYRSLQRKFPNIDSAADDFMSYLNDFGKSLSPEVRARSVSDLTSEPTKLVTERFTKEVSRIQKSGGKLDPTALLGDCIDFYRDVFEKTGKCEFTNRTAYAAIKKMAEADQDSSEPEDEMDKANKHKFFNLMELFLRSSYPSRKSMGLVIAGYADAELFPSLRSFEIDGMIGSAIRFFSKKNVDILFNGPNAKIVPYAQQVMVDRFVSGIDQPSQLFVENFCKEMLEDYRNELMGIFELDTEEDREALEVRLKKAEELFILRLKTEAFGELKEKATADIETMIEFMPKPDLAQMAEALVELTSIKRRVSKGFDTVGGPIDVAVISKSEGFVWIKRKHYFQPDRNARYFAGLSGKTNDGGGHGPERKPAAARPRKRAAPGAGASS